MKHGEVIAFALILCMLMPILFSSQAFAQVNTQEDDTDEPTEEQITGWVDYAAGLVSTQVISAGETPGEPLPEKGTGQVEPAAVALTRTNGILSFRIWIATGPLQDIGAYSVLTGPLSSVGTQNILFPLQHAATSYTTVQSYADGMDLVTTSAAVTPDPGFVRVRLDNAPLLIQVVAPRWVATVWGVTPSGLLFIQIVRVFPRAAIATEANSVVIARWIVVNRAGASRTVGIRYLWDLMLDGDDGPLLRVGSTEQWVDREHTWQGIGDSCIAARNNQGAPVFSCSLSTTTDLNRIVNAFWPLSFPQAYTYTPSGLSTDVDNALLYYWDPLVIPPGGRVSVRETISLAECWGAAVGGETYSPSATMMIMAILPWLLLALAATGAAAMAMRRRYGSTFMGLAK